ncbi:SUKH-3 domain-containing protein [Tundrisphaera sp. TA3]|uniref:SUKH-3 domain-containing protein n=1 Tax=Tundrisphaera sp. TA3 TaxID=3435775 RepID=UPI003EBC468F
MRLIFWLKLLMAGWHPRRDVWERLHLPGTFRVFPEAKRILSEYGNLRFGDSIEWALLDPFVGEEIKNQISWSEMATGRSMYPLGSMQQQDVEYLIADEIGYIYHLTLDGGPEPDVTADLDLLASSFVKALKWLVLRTWASRVELNRILRADGLKPLSWSLGPTSPFFFLEPPIDDAISQA